MESSEKQRRNAKNSYKQLAENLAGFGDILEKTNTHLEEMDPAEAEVQRRKVFKKNLSPAKLVLCLGTKYMNPPKFYSQF